MALIFRTDKGRALSIQELDNNFRHFTGSHTISGSLTLNQGGVSATLSPQNILDLKSGKSIVDSSNARGTDTTYLQASQLFDVNDRTTFVEFSDSSDNFNIVYQNSNIFTVGLNPSSSNNKVIEIGVDCDDEFKVRGQLITQCDITASGDHVISGSKSVGAKTLFSDTHAKIGKDSVIILGNDTSLIKSSMITSTNVSALNDYYTQGVYASSTGLGDGETVSAIQLFNGQTLTLDTTQFNPSIIGVSNIADLIALLEQITGVTAGNYFEIPLNQLGSGGNGATLDLFWNTTGYEGTIGFETSGVNDGLSSGYNYNSVATNVLYIENDAIFPGSPFIALNPPTADQITDPIEINVNAERLYSNLEPGGTTRIRLNAQNYSFTDGLTLDNVSPNLLDSFKLRLPNGALTSYHAFEEDSIEFEVSMSKVQHINTTRTNFFHPIKFNSFTTLEANTTNLDNPILVIDSADNFVKRGPTIQEIITEDTNIANQNAYSTASFGSAGEIVAPSPTSSFEFGFGSGLSGSIQNGIFIIETGSTFDVETEDAITPTWNQTLTENPTATQDAFFEDDNKLHFGTNPNTGESSFIHEYADNLIIKSADDIHLNPSGKVGIDESSPAEMLDVNGNLKVQGAISASTLPSNTTENTVVVYSGGVLKRREFISLLDENSLGYATASFGTAGEVVATSSTSSFEFGFGSGLSGSIDNGILTIHTGSTFSTLDTGDVNQNAYATASVSGSDIDVDLVATSPTSSFSLEAGNGIHLTTGSSGQIIITSSGDTAGDNLGHHTASLDLDMGGNDIVNATFVYSTSSWANNALLANLANTASFVTASNVYGPYGSSSVISASHAVQAVSASYATTASFADFATSSSFATTASYVATASYVPNLQEVTDSGNVTTNAITSSGGLEITGSNKFRLLSQADFVIDNISTANQAEKFALVIDNQGVVKKAATEFGEGTDATGNFIFHVTASDTPDGPFNIIESSSFIFSGSDNITVTSPSSGHLLFDVSSGFITSISGAIGSATESLMPGVHFSSSDGSFSLGLLDTASFEAAGGGGLSASLANDTVTYTLNGVVSSSNQLPGIFFANTNDDGFTTLLGGTASFSASGEAYEDGVFDVTVENGVVNYELNGVVLDTNTSSLENQNAFATASIFDGNSFVATTPTDTLQFQFGNGIFAQTSSTYENTIFISGAGADNLGNHIAEQDLQMGDGLTNYNIDDVNGITAHGDIKLLGTNKISFNNNNSGTFIHANADGSNVEDLALYSENDILLKPDSNVGINIIGTNPTEKLEVGGNVKANGFVASAGSATLPAYRFTGVNSGSGIYTPSPNVVAIQVAGGNTELSVTQTYISSNVAFNTTGGSPITSSGAITASGELYASASNANGSYNQVVVYDTGSGRFYYTGSYGGGGGASDSNTLTLNDNTSTLATLGTIDIDSTHNYMRAEFYAKSGSVIQAARSVFVWNEVNGTITTTTVEDIRTDDTINLFNINSVSGSFDGSGNVRVHLTQYNNLDVDYKLRYILI